MRPIFTIVFGLLLFLGFNTPAYSDDHPELTDIAVVTSNLVVQGTVTVINSNLPNSAVVNQTAVWEGQTYTYDAATGVITVRTVKDVQEGVPSLTVVKVENGLVTFEYVEQSTSFIVKVKIQPRRE